MEIVQQLSTALADRYVIKGEIGRGGMAVVYEAHDVRHHRSVALKVLNPELGAVLGVTRFLEEIRVTANLQHPNLLPLFDSGEANGLLFYVMPYVQGESLRGRLEREKQLPIDEAVHIGASVAGALAYAHAHGVIHRDLKPENILLQQGQPMVADFGIALAVSKAAGERITQTGISLGTPQYMSPEQATGDRVVDGRSDIYSLAALLHEMLTGDPPHSGNTVQSIIAKVLTEEPVSVRVARPNVPDYIAHAISRGLEKVPADRWPSAQAFADALTGGHRVSATDVPAFFSRRSPRSGSRRQAIGLAALFIVAGAAIGAAITAWPRSQSHVQLSVFSLTLPDSMAPNGDLTLSHDGSLVTYVGGSSRSLWVRRLDDVGPQRVVGTDGASCPTFSPDDRWVLFAAAGRLKKIAVRGGAPIVLADSAGRCAVWTDRDEIIFGWREQLFRVSGDGGPISVLVGADSSKPHRFLLPTDALPGGKGVLIGVSDRHNYEWQVGLVSLPDGKLTQLTTHTGMPRYWPRYAKGHVLYREGTGRIVAVPFSLRTHQFTGPEVTVLDDTINTFSVAENGSLAFLAGGATSFSLVAVGANGQTRVLGGNAEQLRQNASAVIPIDTAWFAWPRLSLDGKRVLLEMRTGPVTWDIWVYDIAAHTVSRLTSGFTGIRPSGWMADDRNVVFLANDHATPDALRSVVSQPWDGSAPPRELFRLPMDVHDVTLGPPHGYVAFTTNEGDIWIAPLDTPKAARPFVATAAYDEHPRLTRDGTLLAYTSAETGRPQVYVRPVLGAASRLQVSAASGWQPVWSADGRQLYYRTQGYMMRATIARGPQLSVTRRDTLFRDDFVQHNMTNYDVFPGGKELLMIRAHPNPVHAGIVLNWPELLRQRAPLR